MADERGKGGIDQFRGFQISRGGFDWNVMGAMMTDQGERVRLQRFESHGPIHTPIDLDISRQEFFILMGMATEAVVHRPADAPDHMGGQTTGGIVVGEILQPEKELRFKGVYTPDQILERIALAPSGSLLDSQGNEINALEITRSLTRLRDTTKTLLQDPGPEGRPDPQDFDPEVIRKFTAVEGLRKAAIRSVAPIFSRAIGFNDIREIIRWVDRQEGILKSHRLTDEQGKELKILFDEDGNSIEVRSCSEALDRMSDYLSRFSDDPDLLQENSMLYKPFTRNLGLRTAVFRAVQAVLGETARHRKP